MAKAMLKIAAVLVPAGAVGEDSAEARYIEQDRPLDFQFYRAMDTEGTGLFKFQNYDMASHTGALKYVHAEVVAEHTVSSNRKRRKCKIDSLVRVHLKVKNPKSVIGPGSVMRTQVDFGGFVTFDNGVSTNHHNTHAISKHGGYVGVQRQVDPRWPYPEPYFWYSVTGWCPNVRYDEVPITREEYVTIMKRRNPICSQHSSGDGCWTDGEDCVWEAEACVPKDPVPQCLNYTAESGRTGHVLGGLCPGGAGDLSVEPTGEPDCTYSYGDLVQVSWDEIVGIHAEDCGGRLCTGWMDFREHCTNQDYRQKFSHGHERPVPFKYCVEYDIHPACAATCHSPACQKVPEDRREVGLPFWQGRCRAEANLERGNTIAKAFEARDRADARKEHYKKVSYTSATCIRHDPGVCTPVTGLGGNYCSRKWSGVCASCFIPGTVRQWNNRRTMPYCPFDILDHADYKDRQDHGPNCESDSPRDLCCLYTGTCRPSSFNIADAPLDDDGFAIVTHRGNATEMEAFLKAVVKGSGLEVPETQVPLQDFAERQLTAAPRKGHLLSDVINQLMTGTFVMRPEAAFDGEVGDAVTDATSTKKSMRKRQVAVTTDDSENADSAKGVTVVSEGPSHLKIILISVLFALCLPMLWLSRWMFQRGAGWRSKNKPVRSSSVPVSLP